MSLDELKDVLNLLHTMYPSALKEIENPRMRDRYLEIYKIQIGTKEHCDVVEALYEYQRTTETNFPPNVKQILELTYKCRATRLSQEGRQEKRIMTPEEDCSNEYLEIVNHYKKKKGEQIPQEVQEYLKRLEPYYLLFHEDGWEERYQKHFNTKKTRKEYEKL